MDFLSNKKDTANIVQETLKILRLLKKVLDNFDNFILNNFFSIVYNSLHLTSNCKYILFVIVLIRILLCIKKYIIHSIDYIFFVFFIN